jgi:hypothetical protein
VQELNLRRDDELLSLFPNRKKDDKVALVDVLDVDHKPESLHDEESEADITGEASFWKDEESEDDLTGKPGPEDMSAQQAGEGRLDEQDVVDDPVLAYLREISKVQLITAKEEKVLAGKLDEAKYLKKIEDIYVKQYNVPPSEDTVIIFLLRHLLASQPFIEILNEQLGLSSENSFVRIIHNDKLEAAINGVINQTLINDISESRKEDISEVEQKLIGISLDSRLLPPELLAIIVDGTSWREMESIVSEPVNPEFLTKLESKSQQFKSFFDKVKRTAEASKIGGQHCQKICPSWNATP